MGLQRLYHFVTTVTQAYDDCPADWEAAKRETLLMPKVRSALAELIRQDDWLPEACAQPHPAYYQQHLLHCDPLERFSLVSFVWGPGQGTPVHDHTVWGLIGMLRGEEHSQPFRLAGGKLVADGELEMLKPGDIGKVTPTGDQDIHQVRNAYDDKVSISIHFYSGNIGKIHRHVFDPSTAAVKDFVSGYANSMVPNIWGAA
ncbi:cysteine dioxygenase [Bordetella genomosp. 10]|uniref:Cysteine dioxygenase n=1 Tax=Bordetella genomosp. 10 TaxID=1416804 RepID=A0A261SKH4_9BORD|nr:cysteine dioxygenase [Bordetella genomosp. 10]OZI37928.1 cysteine dioxygenase [Bordetella genomosp. 10]